MDPTAFIPTPDANLIHWAWFQLFLLLTFFIHILLMNVMLGTAFIALVSHFRRDASSLGTGAVSRNQPWSNQPIAFWLKPQLRCLPYSGDGG
jgi:hypothetical protein